MGWRKNESFQKNNKRGEGGKGGPGGVQRGVVGPRQKGGEREKGSWANKKKANTTKQNLHKGVQNKPYPPGKGGKNRDGTGLMSPQLARKWSRGSN